jgi:electron transport complex protein RnfG
MNHSKEIILTLFSVAMVCAVILSLVYSFTLPQIETTKKNSVIKGLKEIIPASKFIEVIPETLWNAVDSAGNLLGIAFRVFPQGYGGPIPITVGIDLKNKITGVKIASAAEGLKETPGLGAKVGEKDFIKQFAGKSESEVVIKKDGGEIDAITAATISSRAVCKGIRQGIARYSKYLTAGLNKKSVFPEATDFYEIIPDTLWYAVNKNETLGIIFIGKTEGYSDDIKFMVGLGGNGKISKVDILYSNETEGVGEQIRDSEFLNKFKTGIPEAITGATISSQALIKGIKSSIERFKDYLK